MHEHENRFVKVICLQTNFMTPVEYKRQEVITELINTEKEYINDLNFIIDVNIF